MSSSSNLHPGLRTAWQFAEKTRGELLQTIRPLTSAQWTFRRDAGAWCVADVVEHLLRAEIGSSKMVRKLIRGDYRGQAPPASATLYTAQLNRYPYERLDAPASLIPGPVRDRSEVEPDLDVAHERFRTVLAQFHGDDPESLQSPDPATGVWYTLGGWVKLQAWHEAHHIAQIRGITASLPY